MFVLDKLDMLRLLMYYLIAQKLAMKNLLNSFFHSMIQLKLTDKDRMLEANTHLLFSLILPNKSR